MPTPWPHPDPKKVIELLVAPDGAACWEAGGVAVALDGSPLLACAIPAGRTAIAATVMTTSRRFRISRGRRCAEPSTSTRSGRALTELHTRLVPSCPLRHDRPDLD